MSKLTLQYEGIALKDYSVGTGATIGRLPDNAVVIDNPAVSGHHARVFQEGIRVILEDLRSTNGTFVNGRPITRHVLQHGDDVLVGRHQLRFDQNAAEPQPAAGAPMQGLGDTVGRVLLCRPAGSTQQDPAYVGLFRSERVDDVDA